MCIINKCELDANCHFCIASGEVRFCPFGCIICKRNVNSDIGLFHSTNQNKHRIHTEKNHLVAIWLRDTALWHLCAVTAQPSLAPTLMWQLAIPTTIIPMSVVVYWWQSVTLVHRYINISPSLCVHVHWHWMEFIFAFCPNLNPLKICFTSE